jgi:hypothetical protein
LHAICLVVVDFIERLVVRNSCKSGFCDNYEGEEKEEGNVLIGNENFINRQSKYISLS